MSNNAAFQILKAKHEFRFKTPIIARNTTPTGLSRLWSEIQDAIDQFDEFANCVRAEIDIKTNPNDSASEDTEPTGQQADSLQAMVDKAKSEIVCSALKPDLLQLYECSMFNTKLSVEVLESNLKSVLGELTPQELKRKLKADFGKLTRRCDINEKFGTFLDRLIVKATKLSENADFRAELVADQFESSLRPMDTEAIDTFCESQKTGIHLIRDQAELLDKKKFFKRSEVQTNHLELQESNMILVGEVERLTKQVAAIQSQADQREASFQEIMSLMTSKMDQIHHSIKSQETGVNSTKMAPPAAAAKPTPVTEKKVTEKKKIPFTDPDYFCFNCGRHKCSNKHKCSGDNSKLFCPVCQKRGHLASSRKHHQPVKESKNEQ